MKSLLLSQFNFDEDWIYEDIRKNFTGNERIVVCPLTFSPEKIENDKLWNAFYGKSCVGYEEIMKPLRKFGYIKEKEEKIEWLNYFKDSKEKFKEKIKNSDILILPGGLPDWQMKKMEELEITEIIRTYKGFLIGKSSGALTQTEYFYLSPDLDYPVLKFGKGIGRINMNCYFEVHFDKENKNQVEALKKAQKEKYSKVIALGDKGALMIENNQMAEYGDIFIYND